MAFSELTLALAVIMPCRSFLYLVTLALWSVVCAVLRVLLHNPLYFLESCFPVRRVKNGSLDSRCAYEVLPYSCTGERVRPLSRTANPRF